VKYGRKHTIILIVVIIIRLRRLSSRFLKAALAGLLGGSLALGWFRLVFVFIIIIIIVVI
jgi:hypothetical protein